MKVTIHALCILALVFSVSNAARAEEEHQPKLQGGINAGVTAFGIIGPRSVQTPLFKIRFSDAIFKPGFTGGVEGLYNFNQKHSLALGLQYEQRKVDLRIGSIVPALYLVTPLLQYVPFVPAPLAPIIVSFLPYEKLVNETSLSIHSIHIPISYRFFALDHLYFGLGLNLTIALKAKAEYKILIPLSMDLKPYLREADFGGHAMIGATYKGLFIELLGGLGFLDYDTFNGERRSVYVKALVGYRFPSR